jgi:hypothetical protein
VTIFDVSLHEPARPGVNADTLAYTADESQWPTADGGLLDASETLDGLTNVISAEIYEPVHPGPGADTTLYTADESVWPTADGGILEGATESQDASVNADIVNLGLYEYVNATDDVDAELVSAIIAEPGGGYPPLVRRRPAVVGFGYGILPDLEGEAFGAIGIIGRALGAVPRLGGAAAGVIGAAGRSAGQIGIIIATAIGQRGQVGAAIGVFKDLSITSNGVAGTHGSGLGAIVQLRGSAIGRHNDDEAAIMSFLLAA